MCACLPAYLRRRKPLVVPVGAPAVSILRVSAHKHAAAAGHQHVNDLRVDIEMKRANKNKKEAKRRKK